MSNFIKLFVAPFSTSIPLAFDTNCTDHNHNPIARIDALLHEQSSCIDSAAFNSAYIREIRHSLIPQPGQWVLFNVARCTVVFREQLNVYWRHATSLKEREVDDRYVVLPVKVLFREWFPPAAVTFAEVLAIYFGISKVNGGAALRPKENTELWVKRRNPVVDSHVMLWIPGIAIPVDVVAPSDKMSFSITGILLSLITSSAGYTSPHQSPTESTLSPRPKPQTPFPIRHSYISNTHWTAIPTTGAAQLLLPSMLNSFVASPPSPLSGRCPAIGATPTFIILPLHHSHLVKEAMCAIKPSGYGWEMHWEMKSCAYDMRSAESVLRALELQKRKENLDLQEAAREAESDLRQVANTRPSPQLSDVSTMTPAPAKEKSLRSWLAPLDTRVAKPSTIHAGLTSATTLLANITTPTLAPPRLGNLAGGMSSSLTLVNGGDEGSATVTGALDYPHHLCELSSESERPTRSPAQRTPRLAKKDMWLGQDSPTVPGFMPWTRGGRPLGYRKPAPLPLEKPLPPLPGMGERTEGTGPWRMPRVGFMRS